MQHSPHRHLSLTDAVDLIAVRRVDLRRHTMLPVVDVLAALAKEAYSMRDTRPFEEMYRDIFTILSSSDEVNVLRGYLVMPLTGLALHYYLRASSCSIVDVFETITLDDTAHQLMLLLFKNERYYVDGYQDLNDVGCSTVTIPDND